MVSEMDPQWGWRGQHSQPPSLFIFLSVIPFSIYRGDFNITNCGGLCVGSLQGKLQWYYASFRID